MSQDLTAKVSGKIHAPIDNVWHALTDAAQIKQYFFGVDVATDWQEGSDIIYTGEWEGEAFEERGTILKVNKPTQLVSNYWTPSSGLPDTTENRQVITYDLEETDGVTTLTITQSGNRSEQQKIDSEKNWQLILDELKKLLEKKEA